MGHQVVVCSFCHEKPVVNRGSRVGRVLRAIEVCAAERGSVRKLLGQVPPSARAGFRSASPDVLERQRPK
jgi:hypothetical protein